MALVNGDMVMPASVVPTVAGVSNPLKGTLLPGSILFGTRVGANTVYWNDGSVALLADEECLRKVEAEHGTPATPVGTNVQVTGKGPAFRGVVRLTLKAELASVGGTGGLTSCVVVRTPSGRDILLPASSVEAVS